MFMIIPIFYYKLFILLVHTKFIKIGYNISITSVSIGAFGIQIKNPDKLVKNNIRNYKYLDL